jgi:hypothetical protein
LRALFIYERHIVMANTEYISSGNNADLVKLIKDYALFLFKPGEEWTMPTSTEWQPPADKKPVGYNSEDGAVLHPEPGDTTEIKAHNGEVVVSDTAAGNWTLQIPGIQSSKDIVESYFGTTADEHGYLHVKDATTSTEYGWVLAALDQHGKPIVVCGKKAKVTDRDDMTLSSSEVLTYNITLSLFKGSDGYMFHAYGLLPESSSAGTPATRKASK